MGAPRGLDLAFRLLVGLALLACAYQAARRGIAAAYFRTPTPERIEQAIRWDPGRAPYYAALARVRQYSPAGAEPGEVIRLYETAAALSPRQANYWAELADAYELAGQLPEAQRAYERAGEAAPNSPQVNWQRGNFLLRRGRVAEALAAFQPVLLARPDLRPQAFDLAWRASDDPALILETMMPRHADIALEYLNYLVRKERLAAAAQVWTRLLAWHLPFEPQAALPYLDALRAHQRPEEMQAAWASLVARHPQTLPRPRSRADAVTNGGFETNILNGGLDWRVTPLEGVVVSVDTLVFFDGARSLHLLFDGRHNLDYHHVCQYVPVRPRTAYRFAYFVRTQGLTTDSGPRFHLTDAYDPAALAVTTRNLLGAPRWSVEEISFTTGPATRLLDVCLVRPPSAKFDNRIAGSVWIDQVRLTALPGRSSATR